VLASHLCEVSQHLFDSVGERKLKGRLQLKPTMAMCLFAICCALTSASLPTKRDSVVLRVEPHGCTQVSQDGAVAALYEYWPDVRSAVTIRDTRTGQQIGSVIDNVGGINKYVLSPDGRIVALGVILPFHLALPGSGEAQKPFPVSGTVVRDTWTGVTVCDIKREGFGRFALAFSPDSKLLAGAVLYGPIVIWDIAAGRPKRVISKKVGLVRSVAYSPTAAEIATGGDDGVVRTWSVQTGKLTRTFRGHNAHVSEVSYSADGTLLASLDEHDTVKVWGLRSGSLIRSIPGYYPSFNAIALSNDGKYLAACENAGNFRLWDTFTGAIVVKKHIDAQPTSIVFPPNGNSVVVGSSRYIVEYDIAGLLREGPQDRAAE
jgi:WD40 repeat protein